MPDCGGRRSLLVTRESRAPLSILSLCHFCPQKGCAGQQTLCRRRSSNCDGRKKDQPPPPQRIRRRRDESKSTQSVARDSRVCPLAKPEERALALRAVHSANTVILSSSLERTTREQMGELLILATKWPRDSSASWRRVFLLSAKSSRIASAHRTERINHRSRRRVSNRTTTQREIVMCRASNGRCGVLLHARYGPYAVDRASRSFSLSLSAEVCSQLNEVELAFLKTWPSATIFRQKVRRRSHSTGIEFSCHFS